MKLRTLLYPLLLVVAVRLVLAAATPVFDTSEARYAAMSANMARTGDFLVPRFTYKGEYQSFDGKPPLLFQAGGVACKVFGVNEFAVRLPVLLATGFLFVLLFRVMLVLTDGDRHASLLAVVTLPWSLELLPRLSLRTTTVRELLRRTDSPSAVLGWGVVGITGFWCLTSRVPMAYLMPTVPLACAWLVLRASSEECQRLTRRVPLAAYLTSLVLVVGILGGMFFTDKMQGAAAPFKMKRYSYEFYHGVHGIPAGEVAR